MLLSCKGLSKAFGARKLFENIDLIVHEGDRIGLIGPNGSGKSTLLKILCGHEEADCGQISQQKNTSLSYLSQTDVFDDERTLSENLLDALEGNHLLSDLEKYTKVNALLSRAEFYNPEEKVGVLSGGWRKRLAICRALLTEPDVLVMDEPTNHLDIEGILWLEKLLQGGGTSLAAYILVSHDRRFLENATNSIIELSAVYPEGKFQVRGNYSKFLEERAEFLESQAVEEERLVNKMRREVEWLRRGPKARSTKAKYRIDAAHDLIKSVSEVKTRNRAVGQVDIDFDATGRRTKKLLEALGIAKGYDGRSLFADLDIILSPGSKLGLLGRNGCGKSSLMKILADADREGGVAPDAGTVKVADKVKIVSFDQDRSSINPNISLRDALSPEGDSIIFKGRQIHVVSWAKKFLFRTDQLETPVGQLSGGEQARILLADLMRQPADILLLDEPTNDLDIASLTVLEESLMEFDGALVLVSHDRFLLDRVCDSILGFGTAENPIYYAGYEQWVEDIAGLAKKKTVAKEEKKAEAVSPKKNIGVGRLSYMDQREYDRIEEDIAVAEEAVEGLEAEMADPAVAADSIRVAKVWADLEAARGEVERLYARWEELEEKKNAN